MSGTPLQLTAVAAYGLPGATCDWPAAPLDDPAWRQMLQAAKHQRLEGLLAAAVAAGVFPTTREQQQAAESTHFDAVLSVLRLERATIEAVQVLEAAGVRPRVLKGPAVAHLDYPDSGQRLFSDVDLIVRGAQFDAAVAALVATGSLRRHPQPRAGFDRRFSKGTSFTTPQGVEIDLHRTFAMGPFGLRMSLDDLWGPGRPFRVGETVLDALDDDLRFLHACFHTALGNVVPRLAPQRDVAQMLLLGQVDQDRVRELTVRWQAEAVVARALSVTWTSFRLPSVPLADWAREYQPSGRERRDLAVYSDPDGGYAGKSLAAVRALPTLRERAAFVWALAVPERTYVEGRYASAGVRWRRGLSAARRLRASS